MAELERIVRELLAQVSRDAGSGPRYSRISKHIKLFRTWMEASIYRVPVFAAAACLAVSMSAQAAPPARPQPALAAHPEWPKANPADVASIQTTVSAFYDAISAPAGRKLDRARLDALFVPDGRIAAGLPPGPGRDADVVFLSPDQYADASDRATATKGFFDRNIANQVERFGVMAHVWASYESRYNRDDARPFVRGIKSIDLLNSGSRWYILQVYWDRERPDNPIPKAYLQDGAP